MIINTTNLQHAKNQIKSAKEKPIIVKSHSDEFSRKILEYGKFDVLLLPEPRGKDRPKQLDSAFNHVLAKLAAKNKIAVGIDLKEVSHLEKPEKAKRLALIVQNIKQCRKAKCKIKILNSDDKRSAFEFLISLGASSQQAKDAVS